MASAPFLEGMLASMRGTLGAGLSAATLEVQLYSDHAHANDILYLLETVEVEIDS